MYPTLKTCACSCYPFPMCALQFAPKRAMSAFLSYSKEMRSKIRQEMPGLKNSEVSVVLAQRWRAASEAEKAPHVEREKRDRQQYYQDLAVWRAAEAERVKLEEEERRRQSTRETVQFLNLPEQLHWSSGGSSGSHAGSRSESGWKSGSSASGSGSGSNSGSRVGSCNGGSETGSNPAEEDNNPEDGWHQVTRKKTPHKKNKKKKPRKPPPAAGQTVGQTEGQTEGQGGVQHRHENGYQDGSRPQLQAWRSGPESQAMARSDSAIDGLPDAPRNRPEGARWLSVVVDGATEGASRDAAAAAGDGPTGAPPTESTSGGNTARSKSSHSSGSGSGSTTAGSRSIGSSSTGSQLLPPQHQYGLAKPGWGDGGGDKRCRGSEGGATDSAPGTHSPVSSDGGSKGGLSDTVHEGLSAFVSYLDRTSPEPSHGEARGNETRRVVSPSPRPPGTARFTHSWRQKKGQPAGSMQPGVTPAPPATSPGLDLWDTMMTHQWFSQPGLTEGGLGTGAATSTAGAAARPAVTAIPAVARPYPSEMHTLQTLHSVRCAGLYDCPLPSAPAAGAVGGSGAAPAPSSAAGPAATFANALPPGWH